MLFSNSYLFLFLHTVQFYCCGSSMMSVSYLVVQCQTQIKNVCHLDPDPCVKMFQFFFIWLRTHII